MSVSELEQDIEPRLATRPSFNVRDFLQLLVLRILIPVVILLVLWQMIASVVGITLVDVVNALLRLTLEGDSEGIYLIQHIFELHQ